MNRVFLFLLPFLLCLSLSVGKANIYAAAYPYAIHEDAEGGKALMPLIGYLQSHEVEEGETFLQIARKYGLGYKELVRYHPEIDPWLPEKGQMIEIPGKWILPPAKHEEVVINIPEMRLYRFFKEIGLVKSYPVGIGRDSAVTPVGDALVTEMVEDPSWTVPPSAREKYGRGVIPPGENNPLGGYWIGLSKEHMGIHGTNYPWGVGGMVSRGCIRLYPEHISQFFKEVETGTRVEIIYEPVKIGIRDNLVYMEVHPDVYGLIPDLEIHAWELIKSRDLGSWVDFSMVNRCLEEQKGVPVPVGKKPSGASTFVFEAEGFGNVKQQED